MFISSDDLNGSLGKVRTKSAFTRQTQHHYAGIFDTIDEGIGVMVHPGRLIEPRADNTRAYDEIYTRYCALYPALKQVLS